jgi:hypothetical protein
VIRIRLTTGSIYCLGRPARFLSFESSRPSVTPWRFGTGAPPETVGACLDCLPEACVVVSHATGVGFRRRFHAPVHGIGDVITVEILGAGVL